MSVVDIYDYHASIPTYRSELQLPYDLYVCNYIISTSISIWMIHYEVSYNVDMNKQHERSGVFQLHSSSSGTFYVTLTVYNSTYYQWIIVRCTLYWSTVQYVHNFLKIRIPRYMETLLTVGHWHLWILLV